MTDTREHWHDLMKRSLDAGADGVELNFGCPHGMCERGMGSAVGQQPPVTEKIVSWVMEVATIPVIVKLTPNITDVVYAGRAAKKGGGSSSDACVGRGKAGCAGAAGRAGWAPRGPSLCDSLTRADTRS